MFILIRTFLYLIKLLTWEDLDISVVNQKFCQIQITVLFILSKILPCYGRKHLTLSKFSSNCLDKGEIHRVYSIMFLAIFKWKFNSVILFKKSEVRQTSLNTKQVPKTRKAFIMDTNVLIRQLSTRCFIFQITNQVN